MADKKTKSCGSANCSTSTGICGNITFGTGKLDSYGYWEKPCKLCEDSYIERFGSTKVEDSEEFDSTRFEDEKESDD